MAELALNPYDVLLYPPIDTCPVNVLVPVTDKLPDSEREDNVADPLTDIS